jgi:hypothetical protein
MRLDLIRDQLCTSGVNADVRNQLAIVTPESLTYRHVVCVAYALEPITSVFF